MGDKEDAKACAESATTKFKTQLAEEPDRSDYYARKGCNYVTTLADECHACLPNTMYNLEKMRDDAIERFLETALELPEFNARKRGEVFGLSWDYFDDNVVRNDNMILN